MCSDIPCMNACPTGALDPRLENINDARMGLAVIDIEHCLSWQGLRCEICHRECLLTDKAITITHHPRKLSKHAMFVPMADPFAVLQILLTRQWLQLEVLIGAGIILGFYAIVGSRVWCSWMCPINMVTDLSGWLRTRFGIRDMLRLNRNIRYTVMALALGLSAIMGVAAFEWVSPISMFHRELIFGLGLGWMAILGVFLFDLLVLKNGWCGHLCPLGAFYSLVGKVASVRVRFDAATCTRCGGCAKVCPEPQVLNLRKAAAGGMVVSGECTNCGRCITVCPEHTLSFDWRALINQHNHSNLSDLK
jgi:ferredoxin-type protein NapH